MGIALIIIIAVIAWVIFAVQEASARQEQMRADARQFIENVKQREALLPVQTHILLKSDENAFYEAPASLYENRAVRHYQSGSRGIRVAKGIYIGRSGGRSTSTDELSKIDSGRLTVTNKRLIFDSNTSRNVFLDKIISIELSSNGVQVSVENRQKSMVFNVTNPIILLVIMRLCCQADNPMDLSKTPLEVTWE